VRITKGELRRIIREEANRLDESEVYVRDGIATDDEGNTYRTSMPDGLYKASQVRGGYGSYRDDRYPPRKTQYVGASALQPMIAAVQAALATKPNSFLQSVLGQMEAGRMPSAKQKSIVKRIIKKHDPTSAQLFESAGAMPLVGLTALGNGPMSSRPTASSRRNAISEAPTRELGAVDAALEAVYTAMESAPSPRMYDRLGQIYGELERYREDVYDMLVAMGR